MSKNRQFDRSKCFTFFNTYRTQGKRIREKYGDKMAADYYEAIIDYGLEQKPVTDDDLMLLIGETLLETIDSSQNRRSRSIGENMELTRSILETVRDHPEYSQDNIKEIVGCSKGKVNKVINKFKEGGYADDIDFNIEIKGVIYSPTGEIVEQTDTVYNNKNNINDNYNCIDRDYDRCAVMSSDRSFGVADAPEVAFAPDMVAKAPVYSADVARLRLPAASGWPEEWIKKDIQEMNLRFDGKVSDNDMSGIIARTYRKHVNDDELNNEEIFIAMVKEFTGGTFNCNKDMIKKACAYVCGVPETTFVPRVDPKPDDPSSDTNTDDSGSDDPSSDSVSTDITDSDTVTDPVSDSSTDTDSSDITVSSDTKDSDTVVPINKDNTDISGSDPGDVA